MKELIDLELIIIDDPLRIGEIFPDRVSVRLVIGFRLDKIAVEEIKQEFVQQNIAGRKEDELSPRSPNQALRSASPELDEQLCGVRLSW